MLHLKTIRGLSTALVAGAVAAPGLGETITVDNLRVWHQVVAANPVGVPSSGSLGFQSGFTPPAQGNNPTPTDFDLEISGLDLDGVGGNDDSILFTLRHTATRTNNPQVNVDGLGIGVTGDLSPEAFEFEALVLSVVDVALSPGTAGTIAFDGFTAQNLILAGTNIPVSAQADVNGTTVTLANDFTGQGFQFFTQETAFGSPAATLTIDNVTDSTGNFRHRDSDLSFTYTIPEPGALALVSLGGLVVVRRRRRSV
ncbi:MAG: PEP-CTERM sorting domain-containing protein [Planctomycetota bacterium]